MIRALLLTLSLCTVFVMGTVAPGAVRAASARAPAAAQPVAEPGPLETVAGTGELGHAGDGGPAVDAKLGQVRDVAFDDAGNLYIADSVTSDNENAYIRKVDPDGTISTVAGAPHVENEDHTPHVRSGGLAAVRGIATGPEGEVYIADADFGQVLRLDPGGEPTVVAGTGEHGHGGDGGPATSAQLDVPVAVAVGEEGELYVADVSGYIRRIDAAGIITTIAGTGEAEASGDGGPATEVSLTLPMDVEVGPDGDIYIADLTRFGIADDSDDAPGHRIRRIDADGVITTVAGGEACGYIVDGGPAADAGLCRPTALTVDADGTVYLTDEKHHQIRIISPDGSIDSLPAYIDDPSALAIGPDGALYVGDGKQAQVHRIPLDAGPDPDRPETAPGAPGLLADAVPGFVTVVAGSGIEGFSGDGGPAPDAQFLRPKAVAAGPDGTLYVVDAGNERIRVIEPDGTITTVAGGGDAVGSVRGPGLMEGDGRMATEVLLRFVTGIDVASDGTLFLVGLDDGRVREGQYYGRDQ
ncbi:NHL domain-containing protein [Phytoactinopolyspora halotolerans]|uniref:Teneurin NHL domain-containing protein n=1 Tax=Phytoactinopolyspora halotolerans TaxID=1981512 RepID=A0A6L9SIA1_9ACTN|nr:hypothetical protein [Phytoactinopolyspora halotolerans]NEE04374.1 hypothetical protein [Phytoactinopolyspora halotolerans]